MDKLKTDEPVEKNASEISIETKLVEPEEQSYKLEDSNSIESRIETKNMKPKHEKAKSLVHEKNIEIHAEDDLEQKKYGSKTVNFEGQTQRNI